MRWMVPDPKATLVFVGYQAAGTTGRLIQDGAHEVRIMKNTVPVRCHVEKIEGFSAHADWQGVIRWLSGLESPPRTTFITHGEVGSATAMAGHIKDTFGWEVIVPKYGQSVTLH